MILFWGFVLLLALMSSAFFSGCETGMYRLPRLRLLVEANAGGRRARALQAMRSRPSLFVATLLVGNNVANHFFGLASVVLVHELWGQGSLAEFLVPIVSTPLVFVYGELAPKQLFYRLPYRLIRALAPLLVVVTLVLLPVSSILWWLGRQIERWSGTSTDGTRQAFARHDWDRVLQESREIGLLGPSQLELAQSLFSVGPRSVEEFMTPWHRLPRIRKGESMKAAKRICRKSNTSLLPVFDDHASEPIGFVRAIEVFLAQDHDVVTQVEPFPSVKRREHHGDVLIRLQSEGTPVAAVRDDQGRSLGWITVDGLFAPLLTGVRRPLDIG